MDPRLRELIEAGPPGDEVAVVLKLSPGAAPPADVHVTARFGDVVTCRLRRGVIASTRADAGTAGLKAPHPLRPDPRPEDEGTPTAPSVEPTRERPDLPAGVTGSSVVVAFVDWGLDFAHPDFRRDDGSTRLLALWDQRRGARGAASPYGYGAIHGADAIDRALAAPDPYRALGYDPRDADGGEGTHGTHTLGIAAGNGRAGGPRGLAPEADLVFVHLAPFEDGDELRLGDSVTLLEALDFVRRVAGVRPWVVNLSLGAHAGPHDGTTLVEQAFDALLAQAPGRCIVQSAGNYFARRVHAAGTLAPGETRALRIEVDPRDPTPNEIDLWYAGGDRLSCELIAPSGARSGAVALGGRGRLELPGRASARLHHRAHEPQSGDHNLHIFIDRGAPGGIWTLRLVAERVVDGRFDAWIERDDGDASQARFVPEDAVSRTTTGTICNGRLPIVVGAYDAFAGDGRVAPFSSAGPTRGRPRAKPDLLAPGVRILAPRSCPRDAEPGARYVRKSGTSMAAPHVTGAVALLFAAAPRPLSISETRALVLDACHAPAAGAEPARAGLGYLNVTLAVARARRSEEVSMRSESHDDCCGRVRTAAPPDELVWIQGEVHRLVAGPGRTLTSELIVGDVLVRRLPGRRAHVARVADARLRPADELRADGVAVERRDGDRFVEVIEPGAGSRRMGRLALGAGGVVPFDQMIARPLATGAGPTAATPGEDASDALAALAAYPAARLAWADAPAGGVDFMRRVYEAHVRDAARGAEHFVDNVPAAELERILPEGALDEGGVLARLTGRHAFRLHRSAVADARRLLIALATALEHAQEAGDAGARALSHLRVRSAYRSAGEQLGLWQDNFTMHDGYYMATAARRAAQPGGPHGDAAVARTVDYITRYLAAPGFSNHNRGLAIDLGVDQLIDGSTVELTTSRAPGNRQAWRATWVHAWLVANAASYHFVPLATEEWHWSHDARAAAASAPTEDEPCHDPDPLPQEYFVRGGPIACRHRRLVDPALELDPAQLPHEVAPYAPFVQRVVDLLLTLPAEGPRCSIQRALEIVGVYAVETGWGAHYRGNNLGGVTLGSRTQTWWRAPGLSGDSRIMYFAGFPSLAEFCRAWLEQFVPRPGTRRSGSTRWVETGRLFWEGGEWFPALIQGGYRNDQTAHNPQPSIETHRNATGMAARLWACARLGVSLGATPGAAPRRWWPPAAQAACAELQRQHGLPATGTVVAPDRALDLPTLELLATRAPVGATVAPAPAPAPAPRLTEDDPGFREALADVPLLASHRGAGRPADEPDLILRCNSQALTRDATEIDVLVHFHGHARRGTGPALRLRRKELVAGIDYADPLHPEAAAPRTPVTLGIVPRGRFTGGDAYDFPALVAPGAIDALVELGLARLAASIGRPGLRARRLLLTAHSGGGPSLLHALDTLVRAQARVPEVIHIFDALYAPATGLGHWAERMIERDAEALRHLLPGTDHAAFLRKHGGALRVVYTSGGGTVASSVALAGQLEAALQTLEAPLAALLRRQYRVELTDDVPHGHLPRVLGWRLLADPAANLT